MSTVVVGVVRIIKNQNSSNTTQNQKGSK